MSLRRASFATMGTVASLAAPRGDIDVMATIVEAVLWDVERRFSPYRADSELSRLQRDPALGTRLSPDMREVLTACHDLQQRTDGAFRPYDRSGRVATTGYVKGWAMARAGRELSSRGYRDWNLTVGGDVVVAGRNGDRPWHVAIRHPALAGGVAEVVEVSDAAVATSGDYERGHHIWGRHEQARGGSVTVIGPSIDVADALATALWAAGDRDPAWLRHFPDYGVLRLDPDGAPCVVSRELAAVPR